MESQFEGILKRVASRSRFLNAVKGARQMLLVSLVLTAIYIILAYFGLLPKLELFWLMLGGLAAGALGCAIGYFRRLDLASALYRVDRQLKLGEKLCTIYDLRAQAPASDFLKILHNKIAHVEFNIKKIFPFSRAEKAKLAGVVALAVLWALLAGQYTGRLTLFSWLPKSSVTETSQKPDEKEASKSAEAQDELTQLLEELAEIQQSVEALEQLQQELAGGQPEGYREALAQSAQMLAQRLDALESRMKQEDSTPKSSTSGEGRDQPSQQAEQLKKDLQRLSEKLAQGASSSEINELLQSIAQKINNETIKQELTDAVRARDQEKLESLSQELAAQDAFEQQLREVQEKLEELQASLGQKKPSDPKGDIEKRQSESPKADEGSKQEGKPGEQATSTEAGKTGTPMPKQPSQTPPEFYKAPIRGLLPETPISTKELPGKKAPIETLTTAQGMIYQVNYQKLEAFLQELRDELSPEMLDLIRAYFQLITK